MKDIKVVRKHRNKQGFRFSFKWLKRTAVILAVVLIAVVAFFGIRLLVHAVFGGGDAYVIENDKTSTLIMKTGDKLVLSVSADDEVMRELEFESSNPQVLSVDSGGRVDALSEGKATVTVESDDYFGACVVTVGKADKKSQTTEYTNAYTANLDVVEKNKQNKTKNLYKAIVNRRTNTVTIYTYDDDGKYTVPVRAMVCSCGLKTTKDITPIGTYSVYFKHYWQPLYGNVYGKYVTGFSGDYLFHSVPYLKTESNTLKTDEFNKLGVNASQGCVRLMVSDAKWVYDNLDKGTVVVVVDKEASGDPLGKPEAIKANHKIKWDPSDPHKNNPYLEKGPVITGAKDMTIKVGQPYKQNVKAKDTCSNDVSDKIDIIGNVITSKPGTYLVTYSIKDGVGKQAEVTVTVTVEE